MKKKILIAILLLGILGTSVYKLWPRFDNAAYHDKLTKVQANDLLATQIFLVDEDLPADQYKLLAEGGVAKYEENMKILDEMKKMPNLPGDKKEQVDQLVTYTGLRIDMFNLLAKSAEDETQDYYPQIEAIGQEIEALDIYKEGQEAMQ